LLRRHLHLLWHSLVVFIVRGGFLRHHLARSRRFPASIFLFKTSFFARKNKKRCWEKKKGREVKKKVSSLSVNLNLFLFLFCSRSSLSSAFSRSSLALYDLSLKNLLSTTLTLSLCFCASFCGTLFEFEKYAKEKKEQK